MSGYRLIVCIDIENVPDLKEAYKTLEEAMGKTKLQWETSEEWYRYDSDYPQPPEELTHAIAAYLQEQESNEHSGDS